MLNTEMRNLITSIISALEHIKNVHDDSLVEYYYKNVTKLVNKLHALMEKEHEDKSTIQRA